MQHKNEKVSAVIEERASPRFRSRSRHPNSHSPLQGFAFYRLQHPQSNINLNQTKLDLRAFVASSPVLTSSSLAQTYQDILRQAQRAKMRMFNSNNPIPADAEWNAGEMGC